MTQAPPDSALESQETVTPSVTVIGTPVPAQESCGEFGYTNAAGDEDVSTNAVLPVAPPAVGARGTRWSRSLRTSFLLRDIGI